MLKHYPFLFLRADKTIKAAAPSNPKSPALGLAEFRLHGYPWQWAWKFETGLYLLPSRSMERPDGCRLLLPFPMIPEKWAKFGSGDVLDVMNRYDGLYQPQAPGHYPLSPEMQDESEWCLRLELLFKNWTSMIENGHWEVGADGVLGGIEKFEEADSENKCDMYFIERRWRGLISWIPLLKKL
jgi:hypothetical protein